MGIGSMRLLIVDDEAFVRISFKSYIDWTSYGFEIIGEAADGEEAVKMIDELKPDIVFLDIRMPGKDGIEVLKHIRNNRIKTKVIVLSGYNEFEYVRDAMKLGALDYIHKPSMSADSVISALSNARAMLESEISRSEEYRSLKINVDQNRFDLKALLFREIIDGIIKHEWDIEQRIRSLKVKLKNRNLECFVISIDNFRNVRKRYKEKHQHLLNFAVRNIADELFQNEEELEFLQYDANTFLILKSYSGVRSQREIAANNSLIIRTLKDALMQFLNVSVSIGVSCMHNNVLELPEAFHEGVTANSLKFYWGPGNTFYFDPSAHKCIDSTEKLDKFINEFKERLILDRISEAKSLLAAFFSNMCESRAFAEKHLRELFKNIFYALDEKYNQTRSRKQLNDVDFLRVEVIIETENILEAGELFTNALEQLEHLTNTNDSFINACSSKIKKALEYIHYNYSRDLSLEEIASEVDLNTSYLSRLFKEETGTSLMNYINRYRIEKAIYLLRSSGLKAYEVAELVGYNNVEYFNSQFKKIIGRTPTEYRNSV